MSDIAKKANVSIASVSHALSGRSDQVSPETMERVVAIARELGYPKKGVGRHARRNGSSTVGVILSHLTSPLHMKTVAGIERIASRFGFGLLLRQIQRTEPNSAVEFMTGRRVDGIILVLSSRLDQDRQTFEGAVGAGVPTVVINRLLEPERALHIVVDNEQASHDATQHLIRLGYQRLAHVHLPVGGPDSTEAGAERLHGFHRALAAFGVDESSTRLIEGAFGADAGFARGYAAVDALLSMVQPPLGILCGSGALAYGAMQRARERELRIPQDVAIVGLDDSFGLPGADPLLASVRQPFQEAGVLAMEALIQHLWQGTALRGVEKLPCELLIRQSTVAV